MQYASAKCSLYRSVCLLMGGKESVFLSFQKPKILPNNSHERQKQRQAITFPNWFLLSESKWEGEESLFLQEKQEAHLYANALYFFKFLKHKQI